MEYYMLNQLSGLERANPALPSFLRATSAMTSPSLHAYNRADTAQENNYDKMVGGGAEEQYNTRDALTARRKKKKDSLSFLMEENMLNSSIFDNRFDDFGHLGYS